MPKKVVTKQTSSSSYDGAAGFRNFCNAIAESIGSTATVDTSSSTYSGSISMASLGYDELTIKIDKYGDYGVKTHVVNSETGMDVYVKGFDSWDLYSSGGSYPKYNAFTAVCARDSNNDSVVISVVTGTDSTKTDSYGAGGQKPLVIFAGRDINSNVLFGGGNAGHVVTLCCGTNMQTGRYPSANVNEVINDALHLTKMVNYLAEGYPEMKSAYISVVRPYRSSMDNTMKNQSYYAGGALWFIGGESTDTAYLCKPFDPVIKY